MCCRCRLIATKGSELNGGAAKATHVHGYGVGETTACITVIATEHHYARPSFDLGETMHRFKLGFVCVHPRLPKIGKLRKIEHSSSNGQVQYCQQYCRAPPIPRLFFHDRTKTMQNASVAYMRVRCIPSMPAHHREVLAGYMRICVHIRVVVDNKAPLPGNMR